MIGQRVKEIRTQMGLSQKQLAGNDMTRAYISLVENGHVSPSEKNLRIIALRLEKPMEYFLGEDKIEETEICNAILDRALHKKENNELSTALTLVNKVFSMTHHTTFLQEAYLLLFSLKIEMNQFEEVLEKGEYALSIFLIEGNRKNIVQFYLAMGTSAFRIEDYSKAKNAYKSAVKYSSQLKTLQHDYIQANTDLGTVYIKLGSYEEAIQSFQEAESHAKLIDNRHIHANTCMGLGNAYYNNKQFKEALAWTKQAIDLFQQCNHEDVVLAKHNLAVIQSAIEYTEETVSLLHECLENYKNSDKKNNQASILNELSKYWVYRGDYAKAKEFCDQGIRLLVDSNEGILKAKLYRLMGVISSKIHGASQAYYFLQMSHDLLIRLKSKKEAYISMALLDTPPEAIVSRLFDLS